MAITVPETIDRRATPGERLLFDTLKKHLPGDYIVYHEPDIYGRKPDFLIISRTLGFVVLEVKDYKKSSLVSITPERWTLFTTNNEQVTVKSPLIQARDYAFKVKDLLSKNSNLVSQDPRFHGQLLFPYGYGAVLTHLNETDLVANNLFEVIPPHLCLTRSEINPEHEAFDEEHLIEKIQNMFVVRFKMPAPLDVMQMAAIRGMLFPEVRISAKVQPAPNNQNTLLHLSDIRAMDLHQEKMARQVGEGHRLIRGVAGSGKTLVLTTHAQILAKQNPQWKILVLCFNISLAGFIRAMIADSKVEVARQMGIFDDFGTPDDDNTANIEVCHFHDWLKQLKIAEAGIETVLQLPDALRQLPQYDAILIDEGQDCDSSWVQLALQCLNPETKSFLLVEDRAQSIYQRKKSYSKDIGLSFQGRSRVLKINYRNTRSVVDFAWKFYQAFSELGQMTNASIDPEEIIIPQATMRKGSAPVIKRCASFNDEVKSLIAQMKDLHAKGMPYQEMLILYRVKTAQHDGRWIKYVDELIAQLKRAGIPFYWVTESRESKMNVNYNDQCVKISTIDSSKGLDFHAVFIVGAHNLPFHLEEDVYREASLLYIGMTRARDHLSISYSGQSVYTDYFDQYAVCSG